MVSILRSRQVYNHSLFPNQHANFHWNHRLILNYKGLKFETTFIEYPDIEPVAKELGALPTWVKPDGSSLYTVPFIHDLSTGTVVSDSINIAEYLDKTYPNTPKLFVPGPEFISLHRSFQYAWDMSMSMDFWNFTTAFTPLILNPRSAEFFTAAREESIGKSLEELRGTPETRKEVLAKAEKSLARVSKWYRDEHTIFLVGDGLTYADFILAGELTYIHRVLATEPEWEALAAMNGGRWGKLLQEVEQYEQSL